VDSAIEIMASETVIKNESRLQFMQSAKQEVLLMLRNKFIMLTLVFCLLCTLFPVSAYSITPDLEYPADMDRDYIVNKFVDSVNRLYAEELPRKATKEDVNLLKAFKIYVGTDVFAMETNNFLEVKSNLEKGSFIFEVPMYIEDKTFVANIQRILPATKEDYAMMVDPKGYEAKVGTWDISVISGYFPPDSQFLNYYVTARSVSKNTDKIPLLVGGLPFFRTAVALYPDNNGEIDKLVTLTPHATDWEALGLVRRESNTDLEYSKIKRAINSMPRVSRDSDLTGGGASISRDYTDRARRMTEVMPIVIMSFLFAALVIGYILRHKAKQKI